jgi:biopolymer transport protein ExbD
MAAALGARRRIARHHPASEPNVIPFIDVLLVLLIIFMVTAPKPTVDLQVQLPTHAAAPLPFIPPTIVEVQEGPDGYRLMVGAQETSLDALAGVVLTRVLAADSVLTRKDAFTEAHVYVRADQDVSYGMVVAVIDELQHAGFTQVGVFAQSAEET